MKELLLGIISSMFFAVTFILNRSMELDGAAGCGVLPPIPVHDSVLILYCTR